jgi:hypothetical protein
MNCYEMNWEYIAMRVLISLSLTMEDYGREAKLARTTKQGHGYVTLPQDGCNYQAGAVLSKKNMFPDVNSPTESEFRISHFILLRYPSGIFRDHFRYYSCVYI